MATNDFKPGQAVIIETVNGGARASRLHRVQTWRAHVIGPSPIGNDLWLVHSGKGRTFTVPAREMKRERPNGKAQP